jgi:hypothetical protein
MENPNVNSVAPESNPSTPAAQPPRDPNFISQVPPAIESKQEATRCKPDQTPFWKIVLETFAVVVGILVAIIYYGQLKVMRGQLAEIIKQFPELQKSANANVKSADQTEIAVRNAAENFRLDERAWVGLKSVTVHFGLKPTPIIEPWVFGEAVVVNSGKTVALDVATYCLPLAIPGRKIDIRDWPEIKRNLDKMSTKTASYSMLVPNATVIISLDNQLKRGFALPDIEAEKIYAYLIGRITYEDIFRRQHTTIWCGRYKPHTTTSSNMVACPKGFEYAD